MFFTTPYIWCYTTLRNLKFYFCHFTLTAATKTYIEINLFLLVNVIHIILFILPKHPSNSNQLPVMCEVCCELFFFQQYNSAHWARDTLFLFTKTTKSLFEPLFGGVRGNVRTSYIVRWKASGRIFIRDNWTLFASSYGSNVISRYWLKSALFRGGWVSLSAYFRWKGTSLTNLRWYQKTRMIIRLCGIKISAVCSIVSSQSMRVTDERTDRQTDGLTGGQNYDPQDRVSIDALRGKNHHISALSIIILPLWSDKCCRNCVYLIGMLYLSSTSVYILSCRPASGASDINTLHIYVRLLTK